MLRPLLNLFTAFILLLTFSCDNDKAQGSFSNRAFYYWRTSLYDFRWSDSTFNTMHINKLYVRVFDVDWNKETKTPVPVSPIEYYNGTFAEDSFDVVPVVFITNETFKQLDLDQSVALARQVHKKMMRAATRMLTPSSHQRFYEESAWEQNPYRIQSRQFNEQAQHDSIYAASITRLHEVQFDCDWTKSTRDKYFAFLEESKKLFAQQLVTSTVRLYQYKYPKEAGVPPVKRGMLMCYNAGDVKDPKSINSIFDKDEVMSYLKSGDYSLPLDYALPIFDWALLYSNGELKAILSMNTLQREYSSHTRVIDATHLRASEDFVYGYTSNDLLFIRKGDEIRIEKPNMEQVSDVARWLSSHKNNSEAVLTFYHLNDYDFQEHSKAIEAIFNSF
jgi:hypothetical protein